MKIINNLTKLVSLSLVGVAAALFLTACDTMPNAAVQTSNAESVGTYVHSNGSEGHKVQEAVQLGYAGNFAILSQTGITNVYQSAIVGDVGTSPITGAAIHLTCPEVQGNVYSVDAGGPLACRITKPSYLTTAVADMGTAYTNATGRTEPVATELGDGEIGGETLTPGLYKWATGLLISTDVTLSGNATDVWILQIAGTLKQANGMKVLLEGGAKAENVFWAVAGAVSIGTTAVFQGNLLAKTSVAVNTGATVNGRLLAQTAVTLQKNIVTKPNAPSMIDIP
jgi:hypothetical protein